MNLPGSLKDNFFIKLKRYFYKLKTLRNFVNKNNFLNSPLETIKINLTSYKYWISAFAGMTPFGLTPQSLHSHSRVSGNPDKKSLTMS